MFGQSLVNPLQPSECGMCSTARLIPNQEYRNYIYAPVAIIGGAAGVYNSTLDCD